MPPKIARRALRRPAAAAPRLRRPAARDEGEEEEEAAAPPRLLSALTFPELKKLGPVCLQDSKYYGRTIHLAGRLRQAKIEEGEMYVDLTVTGTKDDELLRVLTGTPSRKVSIHCCTEECSGLLTDPLLVHGPTFDKTDLKNLPWLTNLEAVATERAEPGRDELAELRRMQVAATGADAKEKKNASKKEKKKRSADEMRAEEGRLGESPNVKSTSLEQGQKALNEVYSGTGLDPNPSRREKILKKAKKIGKSKKKKKKKASSGSSVEEASSTTSSSSSGFLEVPVFLTKKTGCGASGRNTQAPSQRGPSERPVKGS